MKFLRDFSVHLLLPNNLTDLILHSRFPGRLYSTYSLYSYYFLFIHITLSLFVLLSLYSYYSLFNHTTLSLFMLLSL